MSDSLVISLEEVQVHLRDYFGLTGSLKSLGSCQDTNFKFVSSCGKNYVVKYANKETLLEELEFQHDVLRFLNEEAVEDHLQFPCPLASLNGTSILPLVINGQQYYMHLLTYIKGDLLSDYSYLSDETLFQFGKDIAGLNLILQRFPVAAIPKRSSMWDLKRAYDVCVEQYDPLDAVGKQLQLLPTLELMQNILKKNEAGLRSQLIHCDLAHYNVIAKRQANGRPKVSGVIDFGDILESWLAADLAIAIAPLLIRNDRDCVHYAVSLVKGFTSVFPLQPEEVECLWPMIIIRSILLYVTVSHLLKTDPSNEYLRDEIVLNREVLEKLLAVNPYYAYVSIKNAAGHSQQNQLPASAILNWFSNDQQCVEKMDISCMADMYEGENWMHRDAFRNLVAKQVSCSNTTYTLPMGDCWFTRANVRSLTAPKLIPTFSVAFLPQNSVLTAPFSGSFTCVNAKEYLAAHGKMWPHELFDETDGADLVLCTLESAHAILYLVGRFVGESRREIVGGQLLLEINRDKVGHSPVAVQCLLKESSCPVDHGTPPLFCDEEEWKNWKGFFVDALNSFAAPMFQFEALSKRRMHVASCQEHYFKQPPNIERACAQYMYDIYGRAYLDVVNNVAVLGHCHPKLTKAVTTQLKRLNTNSRFVYSSMSAFAEKIIDTLPKHIRDKGGLNKVVFVNSGSEATDLALRIARTVATERRKRNRKEADLGYGLERDVICVEGGYHGITTASDEVSTTLNDNPNSLETRAPWIHLVAMPNLYRGKHKASGKSFEKEEDISRFYSDIVKQKVDQLVEKGTPPSAFIAEPLEGNAGGVILPKGYLKQVYEHMRTVGALCICDEVQIGYGRLGNVFWGFEEHDIVPDIITMAKAAGNGHPIGYVVTSEEIIKEFVEAQGSFFSSAGGGPVSSTVGCTVLDIVKEEKLQQNALEVGEYLHEKLLALQLKHKHIIGCIHGHGLYQGIELVRGGEEGGLPAPATAESYAVCERLLDLGVICHNTGDYSNVLKMKPPLCMNKADADFFVEALDITLSGW